MAFLGRTVGAAEHSVQQAASLGREAPPLTPCQDDGFDRSVLTRRLFGILEKSEDRARRSTVVR